MNHLARHHESLAAQAQRKYTALLRTYLLAAVLAFTFAGLLHNQRCYCMLSLGILCAAMADWYHNEGEAVIQEHLEMRQEAMDADKEMNL